jgi:drug/metabolite transporter (DMT)-like permease
LSANIDSSTRKQTFKAIGIFLLAITCFDIMAVFVRILLAHYSAQELSAYRNVIGIIPSIVLLIYTRELTLNLSTLVIKQWRLALLRGVSVAVAQLCYYSAIGVLDLATVSTLGQTNAFFVVILSVIIIGEKVGIWRWAALLLGFLGAMLILRPGTDSFSIYALLPICAAFLYGISIATLPKFDRSISNGLLYLYSSVGAGLGAIILAAIMTDFTPIYSLNHMILIFIMSITGGIGVLLMMIAYRMAPPSVLSPFIYFGILTAFIFGWVFFGEFPVDTLFPGVLLIVGAGALIVWRENKVKKI